LKKVYIASDHAGFTLKEQIKKKLANKINIIDLGTDNSTTSVNYPNYAHQLCKKVSLDNKNIGILVCGSGMGMSMAANRHKKIRAALMLFIIKYKIIKIA
jgi:ribose 5-phosphate isomerase B